MVQINFSLKEVNCKVVYYGPGLSGKTTNLEVVHAKAPVASVGELTSIATEGDRTLFFDFLPLNLGQVAGMKTKFQIYTVPGQVYYNSTRKLVLQGSDGIVFVADSKRGKMEENLESLNNLKENLEEYGMDISTTPIVLQYNKRDLPEVYTIEEMQQALNPWNTAYYEAVARDGVGVFPTLKKLAAMVLESLNQQHGGGAPAPAPAAAAASRTPVAAGAVPQPMTGGATAVAERPPMTAPPPPAMAAQSTVRPGQRAVAPQARSAPEIIRPQGGATSKKKGKGGLIAVCLVLALGGAAAFLYFSGLLDTLLP